MVGLKLYTEGVMIVGFSKIEDIDGNIVDISEKNDLKEGDRILSINGEKIDNIGDVRNQINASNGEIINMTVIDINGKEKNLDIEPIHTGSNSYRLGLWVKDAATGVGTLSFYIPSTGRFVALGHGIVDSDTDSLLNINYGEITGTSIVSIVKGISGNPGEVRGTINSSQQIGIVEKNTEFGLYGNIVNLENLDLNSQDTMKIALRNEIKTGEATILSNVEGGETKEYSVDIEEIYLNNNEDNKSFVIKVTDEDLLNVTGGIIRGLSGSPIIQNNKLVGVVTNVLVSNPEIGYGVFADMLIEE